MPSYTLLYAALLRKEERDGVAAPKKLRPIVERPFDLCEVDPPTFDVSLLCPVQISAMMICEEGAITLEKHLEEDGSGYENIRQSFVCLPR